jgi:hypothetical protein
MITNTEPDFSDVKSHFYRQKKVADWLIANSMTDDFLKSDADIVVKEKKEEYLIRRPEKVEPVESYDMRLKSAVFINAYADGVDAWSAMMQSAGVSLTDEAKAIDIIEEIESQADRSSNDLVTFSGKVFKEGVGRGAAFVLIEGPEKPVGPLSKETAISAGIRPWLSFFGPDRLLGWNESNGELTGVRFYWRESLRSEEDNEDILVWIAREYVKKESKVFVSEWKWMNGSLSGDAKENQEISIERIPLVAFLPGEEAGLLLSSPPAYRLASLTKAYYNSLSLQQSFAVSARSPLLCMIGSGLNMEEVLKSLYSFLCISQDKQTVTVDYVEHSKTGADVGKDELTELKNAIRVWGVDLEKQAGELATVRVIDNAIMTRRVVSWSKELQKTLQSVLEISVMYYSEKFPKNGVHVGVEYGLPTLATAQLQLIDKFIAFPEEWLFNLLKAYVPQLKDVKFSDVDVENSDDKKSEDTLINNKMEGSNEAEVE